jgi:tetratricopeptide (TPR) repeat protein
VASGVFWVAGSRESSVPFEARDWVLVTAFDNRTGDRLLDATMAQAIEAELGTSSFVNVVPRERVNDTLLLMGRPLDTRVDANVGRQVAIRDGKIRALVEGHIERTENAYRVQARIFSPSGSTIATMTASAGDALAAAWQAAVEIRRRLGEPMPPLAARSEWPRATTSLRALNQYAMAMKLRADMKALWKDDAQREAVERVLQSAITEDPDFAMAHLALAITVGERINNRGRRDETALHARNALALAGRLPDSERLYIIGCANLFLGAAALDAAAKSTYFQQSESAFAELLRQQPDHVRALGHLASLFRLTERPDDRLRTYLQIGNLRPNAFDWRSEAARLTFSTGDHHRARLFAAEAAALLTRAELESDPTLAVWIKLFPVTDAWIQGNATLALRRLDEIARELPTAPKVGLPQFGAQVAFLYLTLGRVEQARATAQILTDEPKLRLQLEAWAVLEKEGPSELRARLAGRTTGELSMVHGLLLDAGMVNEFRQVVTLGRTERQLLVVVNDFQLGQIALIEGRMNDGLHHLQKAAGDPATGQMRPWVLRASIALADLLHRRGDRAGAIKTLERVSQVPRWQTGSVWVNGFSWVRMRAALAALYRDTGRIADAERVENELRPLLAAADPDHPVKMQLERVR